MKRGLHCLQQSIDKWSGIKINTYYTQYIRICIFYPLFNAYQSKNSVLRDNSNDTNYNACAINLSYW